MRSIRMMMIKPLLQLIAVQKVQCKSGRCLHFFTIILMKAVLAFKYRLNYTVQGYCCTAKSIPRVEWLPSMIRSSKEMNSSIIPCHHSYNPV